MAQIERTWFQKNQRINQINCPNSRLNTNYSPFPNIVIKNRWVRPKKITVVSIKRKTIRIHIWKSVLIHPKTKVTNHVKDNHPIHERYFVKKQYPNCTYEKNQRVAHTGKKPLSNCKQLVLLKIIYEHKRTSTISLFKEQKLIFWLCLSSSNHGFQSKHSETQNYQTLLENCHRACQNCTTLCSLFGKLQHKKPAKIAIRLSPTSFERFPHDEKLEVRIKLLR